MTIQELHTYIDRTLGNNVRCLLSSFWWKKLFHLVVDKVDEAENKISDKQDRLKSGSNIKTINGKSILGSGDIEIAERQDKTPLYFPNEGSELPEDLKTQNIATLQSLKNELQPDANNFTLWKVGYIGSTKVLLPYQPTNLKTDFDDGFYVSFTSHNPTTLDSTEYSLHFKINGTIEWSIYNIPQIFAYGDNGEALTESQINSNIKVYNYLSYRKNLGQAEIMIGSNYMLCNLSRISSQSLVFQRFNYDDSKSKLSIVEYTLKSDGNVVANIYNKTLS